MECLSISFDLIQWRRIGKWHEEFPYEEYYYSNVSSFEQSPAVFNNFLIAAATATDPGHVNESEHGWTKHWKESLVMISVAADDGVQQNNGEK